MPFAEKSSRDFKRFVIRPLHLQNITNRESAPDLYFNSIITEFSDSWTPRWNSVNVYGRMDPLPFYGGTSRELTFGFRVVSDSAIEAKRNMAKIQKLIQYQYPFSRFQSDFRQGESQTANKRFFIQAPPYFELEFLNLFKSGKSKVLKAYINGPVQINPGFQTKDQAQYFSLDFSEIYFSDVTITLRLQVLHEVEVVAEAANSRDYPYGIDQGVADNLDPYAVTVAGASPPPAGGNAQTTPPDPGTPPRGPTAPNTSDPTDTASKAEKAARDKVVKPRHKDD
tara:strand:+ start:154 stop:999 length:846 start_codon:yes stop_codon:yes gene_type:complete